MNQAVIDIGTNSTRLYLAETIGKQQTGLFKKLATTRLGEGIGSSNYLQEAPMERTADAVAFFAACAREYGVKNEQLYVYATAAAREAENRQELEERIFRKAGIRLDVIDGEQEALIAFLGAAAGREDYAVIDIGGGSTEVICMENGRTHALSQKIGGVRLAEQFPFPEGRIDDIQAVKDYCMTLIPGYRITGVDKATGLIGVSGTPTTFASWAMGLNTYQPAEIQDLRLPLETLNSFLARTAAMTLEERKQYAGEFADRADIIVYGGCMLSAFMEYYGFRELLVSDRDSLEGYLETKL